MSHLEKLHVLVVDDSATVRNSIERHLGDAFFVLHAADGQQAWDLLVSNSSIALVFADLNMPVMNGMILLKQIRDAENARIRDVPVIMITGHSDSEAAKRVSYDLGATDFISKPFSALDIISRAGSYVSLSRKISRLEEDVIYDSLTGLYNQNGFNEMGKQAIASARRYQHEVSVFSMQIVDLRKILSVHGKKIVRQIIVTIAKNLKQQLRKEEVLAHTAAGVFSVILPMASAFKAVIVAKRFQKTADKFVFKVAETTIRVQLAVGLDSTQDYSYPIEFSDLCNNVDKALKDSILRSSHPVVRFDEIPANSPEEPLRQAKDIKMLEKRGLLGYAPAMSEQMMNDMQSILRGRYQDIPLEHMEPLALQVRAFIAYVDQLQNQQQIS